MIFICPHCYYYYYCPIVFITTEGKQTEDLLNLQAAGIGLIILMPDLQTELWVVAGWTETGEYMNQ